MASPAFQENAFQNFTAHGIKGFQVSDSDAGGGGAGSEWTMICHHFHSNGAWLLPVLVSLLAGGG